MGTDCKSAAFQLRWFESTRAHQELQRCDDAGVSVLFELLQSTARVDSNSCGPVAEEGAKTAQRPVVLETTALPTERIRHEKSTPAQVGKDADDIGLDCYCPISL